MKLKFIGFLITVIALSNHCVRAQRNIDTKKLRLGVFASPTMSWMRPTTVKSNDREFESKSQGSKIGFIYGLMVEYNFADNYAFVTGIQGNMTGGKIYTERSGGFTQEAQSVNAADFDYNYTYLEIPFALKMRTDPVGNFRFFGQAGITASINIAKKASYSVQYTDANGSSAQVNDSKVILKGTLATSPVLFQMNIGLGAEYSITDKLGGYAGFFFNNGFAPDATNPNNYDLGYSGSFKDGNTRLNNFALRIGLLF